MTDYERHAPRHPLPRIERSWTIGTVLAAGCSIVSLMSVVVAITWGYARVTYATDTLPDIQKAQRELRDQQEAMARDVSNLKLQQGYSDSRYAEILAQLAKLNDKVDRLNDNKADKQLKGWTR